MNKLKIYVCSGVGGPEADATPYWLDDTSTISNTVAVNALLVQINYLNTELQHLSLSQAEQIERYNTIDALVLCLVAAKTYTSDEELTKAGRIIADMYEAGKLSLQSTSDEERDKHLTDLEQQLQASMKSATLPDVDTDFYGWYLDNVVRFNRPALSEDQQQRAESFLESVSAKISGIGAAEYGDITPYLRDAGNYFLYLYIPESLRSKCSRTIQRKIQKQQEVYEYVKKGFVGLYGTEETLQQLIRSKIVEEYGAQPEDVVAKLNKASGVGYAVTLTVAQIISIILAAVSVVVTIIREVVLPWVGTVTASKYTAPADPEAGVPDGTDYSGIGEESSDSKLVKFGAIALLLLFILKRK